MSVPKDERIDYDALEQLAKEHKPKMILLGASAYPRIIDFERGRKIADQVGALLMVDMAHFAGLVATGHHPSPVPYADVVTTTTHKTLRGPRAGSDPLQGKICEGDRFRRVSGDPGRAAHACDRGEGGGVERSLERREVSRNDAFSAASVVRRREAPVGTVHEGGIIEVTHPHPAELDEREAQEEARDEAPDVRPVVGARRRAREGAPSVDAEPQKDHPETRYAERARFDEDPVETVDAVNRIDHKVEADHAVDRPAGADRGSPVTQIVDHSGQHAEQEEQEGVGDVPRLVADSVAEDPQVKHVEEEVEHKMPTPRKGGTGTQSPRDRDWEPTPSPQASTLCATARRRQPRHARTPLRERQRCTVLGTVLTGARQRWTMRKRGNVGTVEYWECSGRPPIIPLFQHSVICVCLR